MRISDWSSDVCSSDLLKLKLLGSCGSCPMSIMTLKAGIEETIMRAVPEITAVEAVNITDIDEIGRASCRERVCVRVDLGGRRIIKKKRESRRRRSTYLMNLQETEVEISKIE